MNKPNFKSKWRLTPSKATLFNSGLWSFIRRYHLEELTEPTPAMEKGKLYHELIYKVIRGEEQDIECMPTEWQTKRECGILITEQKENYRYEREKQGKFLIEIGDIDFCNSFLLNHKYNSLIVSLKKEHKENPLCFEVAKESEDYNIAGVADIVSKDLIIDIKTSGKDISTPESFIKFNEVSLAFQDIIYRKLFEKEVVFIVVGTAWPYLIHSFKLEPYFLNSVENLFIETVLRNYNLFRKKIKKAGEKKFTINPKKSGVKEKERVMENFFKLLGNKLINTEIQTAEVSMFAQQSIERELNKTWLLEQPDER